MSIYVLRVNDNEVKIGYTSKLDAKHRKSAVQVGTTYKVEQLYFSAEGDSQVESRIHDLLKQAGAFIKGEIFIENDSATDCFLTGMRAKGTFLGLRLLEAYTRHSSFNGVPEDNIVHRYGYSFISPITLTGIKITSTREHKRCTGCGRKLPMTESYWGQRWRIMDVEKDPHRSGQRILEIYDQPRCTSCRTAKEYFRDDKTLEMFA